MYPAAGYYPVEYYYSEFNKSSISDHLIIIQCIPRLYLASPAVASSLSSSLALASVSRIILSSCLNQWKIDYQNLLTNERAVLGQGLVGQADKIFNRSIQWNNKRKRFNDSLYTSVRHSLIFIPMEFRVSLSLAKHCTHLIFHSLTRSLTHLLALL